MVMPCKYQRLLGFEVAICQRLKRVRPLTVLFPNTMIFSLNKYRITANYSDVQVDARNTYPSALLT